MKRQELKEIIKECIEEVFDDNELFIKMMTESIKSAISTTLKESLNRQIVAPVVSESISSPKSTQSIKPQSNFFKKEGFDPQSFFADGGPSTIKNMINSPNELEMELNEINTKKQRIDSQIPDEMILGNNFAERMKKFIKK